MNTNWFSMHGFINLGTGLGAITLAILMIVLAIVTCLVTTKLIYRTNWVMGRFQRKVDETVVRYIVRIKNLLIYVSVFIFYASLVPSLRALMSTMLAGAGITALIVGFAARSTLSNLISGLAMAIYRPLRIGDKLNLEGELCTVEDITLRHTIVRTWQHKRLIIPNSKLDEMTITNYSIIDSKIKCTVELGVSYDTDIDLARRLILETAVQCPQLLEEEEEPWVRVISHGDFSIGFRLYLWVKDIDDSYLAGFWLLEQIKKRFDKEGVEIPFPYRTLVYKKDLPPAPKEQDTQLKT
ncbi:mechanosensitive ion channel family protein [Thermodesulfobacteriota bacterium]